MTRLEHYRHAVGRMVTGKDPPSVGALIVAELAYREYFCSLIDDATYDALCRALLNSPQPQHPHWGLVADGLSSGHLAIDAETAPKVALSATWQLVKLGGERIDNE